MDPFRVETGIIAPLPAANVDTDVIMPKQFLKGITRDGLARGVFYDLRFDEEGRERPDFILNRPAFAGVRFLLVGPNFGCGSSREHAVWGLKQFGIRAIIGVTYGSIFQDNCFQNGVLPIAVAPDEHSALQRLCPDDDPVSLVVDLVNERITGPGISLSFRIDGLRRERLLAGLDSVGATLQAAGAIHAFEERYLAEAPWTSASEDRAKRRPAPLGAVSAAGRRSPA
jgi:3-isopropylmalate/(R)-2-methylmalate dehydratase small subunit